MVNTKGIKLTGATKNVKSGVVHGRDENCSGNDGGRLCDRWSVEDSPLYKRTCEPVNCRICLRILRGDFTYKNEQTKHL